MNDLKHGIIVALTYFGAVLLAMCVFGQIKRTIEEDMGEILMETLTLCVVATAFLSWS